VVGDTIEFEALADVYGHRAADPCYLGAVKTNLGHLEGAAGAAGVIKMVLCLQHRRIPPNLNFREINPHIRLESTRFHFPLEAQPWSVAESPRRGAVSSFGLGGTNGHVILEEAPETAAKFSDGDRSAHPFRRQRYWLPSRQVVPSESDDDLLYRLEWQPQPLERPAAPAHTGDWLIVENRICPGDDLAERLRRSGQRAQVAGEFHPLPTGQYRGVVFLSGAGDTSETPAEAEAGSVGLLHLVQALSRSGIAARLWLVTRGCQAVTGAEAVQVARSPLWGLARTVRLEHPEFQCVSVDLAPETEDLGHLAAELLSPGEPQVAYRNGTRYVARLLRDRGELGAPSPKIRGDGCYLITGGLGALGLKVARHLLDQGARQLVLAGRSGRDDDPAVEQLRASGAIVRVVKADVARSDHVARLIETCQTQGPLRGVVHAAGVLDDGILVKQTAERFARVMAPKIRGAWELHIQTQTLPLDFFVCFSSMASLVGSPGQGNYAAANAFLDALAHHRRARGLAGLSINWGPWADAGMAAKLHSRFAGARRGPDRSRGWRSYVHADVGAGRCTNRRDAR
jgi:acyl transferase domain-containing protein